jgi:hypothetical protein
MRQLIGGTRRPSRLEIPSTTFHKHAPELREIGAVERRIVRGPPRQVVYGLGSSGAELCDLIDRWRPLLEAGDRRSGGELDWEAPRRFARAWTSGVVPALFDQPRRRPEVELLARPESGLTSNQVGSLLASLTGHGFLAIAGAAYALTDLGRIAIGELAASARFEREHMTDTVPISALDGANALRGTLPLVKVHGPEDGLCEAIVRDDAADEGGTRVAIAWARIEGGRVVATGSGPAPEPPVAWAQGTIDDWLTAVIDNRPRDLRASGRGRLGWAVVGQLHSHLYGAKRAYRGAD